MVVGGGVLGSLATPGERNRAAPGGGGGGRGSVLEPSRGSLVRVASGHDFPSTLHDHLLSTSYITKASFLRGQDSSVGREHWAKKKQAPILTKGLIPWCEFLSP